MNEQSDGCDLCNQKPVFNESFDGWKLVQEYDKYESATGVARGGWSTCLIGVDEKGNLGCFGWGDGDTDFYFFNYCPKCGRKLIHD